VYRPELFPAAGFVVRHSVKSAGWLRLRCVDVRTIGDNFAPFLFGYIRPLPNSHCAGPRLTVLWQCGGWFWCLNCDSANEKLTGKKLTDVKNVKVRIKKGKNVKKRNENLKKKFFKRW